MPYYLKIDIEGADLLCLKALEKFEEKPKYISIEAGVTAPAIKMADIYGIATDAIPP
jgi:hypothetical protein